jgi:2-amino-4-hydroxy-6-hydroxymethyldihydropteridine diphosphokinase
VEYSIEMDSIQKIILSIGSNIGHRLENLIKATNLLNKNFNKIIISSLYETGPKDDINQNYFYNIAVLYETNIDNPYKLLKITKEIENSIGREKDINRPKGPRKIDIDIIFFENKILNSDILTIPHKSYKDRNFVLIPILEIVEKLEAIRELKDLFSCGDLLSKEYIERLILKNGNDIVRKIGHYDG